MCLTYTAATTLQLPQPLIGLGLLLLLFRHSAIPAVHLKWEKTQDRLIPINSFECFLASSSLLPTLLELRAEGPCYLM